MSKIHLYIGHDHREPDATAVAIESARQYHRGPLNYSLLEHLDLRRRQLFDRPWRIDEIGTMWDERDGKPFSTQFSHSRFLTPIIAKEANQKWALFVDADVMFLEDLDRMLDGIDASKTVHVVPHNYKPASAIKMDNQPQAAYNRKLWSAVMLWNTASPKLPTLEMVNNADGSFLHGFKWLSPGDIGFLPEGWQWLPNESPTTDCENPAINLVHFTTGIPGMPNRVACSSFDQMWQNFLTDSKQ